jgi:hypothetical protein
MQKVVGSNAISRFFWTSRSPACARTFSLELDVTRRVTRLSLTMAASSKATEEKSDAAHSNDPYSRPAES